MKLPGAAWTALILALVGALGGWLTEYVQEPWVPLAILGLSILAKAAEIYLAPKSAPSGVRGLNANATPVKPPSKVKILFLG